MKKLSYSTKSKRNYNLSISVGVKLNPFSLMKLIQVKDFWKELSVK